MIKLSHTKKPKRSDAFDMALQLKASGTLTDVDMDSLINYFAPSIPSKPKTAFHWVARCTNIKHGHPYANYVHVVEGVMYGANGHAMHYAPTELPDGAYCPKTGMPVDWDGARPDFTQVIPDTAKMLTTTADAAIPGVAKLDGHPLMGVAEGFCVQRMYWDAAMPSEGSTIHYGPEIHNAVMGESEYGTWLIMPLRV